MRLERYITEAGEGSWSMELVNTPLEKAREFIDKIFRGNGTTLDEALPEFDDHYKKAQQMASLGHTKRKDMPVITSKDIRRLQDHLKNGDIDIYAPYSDNTDQTDLFPQHLSGKQAKEWLHDGKPAHDGGDKGDDAVKVNRVKVTVSDLKPIQKQIYFDKSAAGFKGNTVESSKKFLSSSVFVISSDDHIIDGHHRYLSAMLTDNKMKVHALKIDLPIAQLLELTLAFGDAIGNKRNA
jgi:hypothetical protein